MRRSLLVAVLAAGVVALGLGIQARESSATAMHTFNISLKYL